MATHSSAIINIAHGVDSNPARALEEVALEDENPGRAPVVSPPPGRARPRSDAAAANGINGGLKGL